jgi:hypothetical protein
MQTKVILIEGKNMNKRIGLTSVGLLAVALIGLNEALAQRAELKKRPAANKA